MRVPTVRVRRAAEAVPATAPVVEASVAPPPVAPVPVASVAPVAAQAPPMAGAPAPAPGVPLAPAPVQPVAPGVQPVAPGGQPMYPVGSAIPETSGAQLTDAPDLMTTEGIVDAGPPTKSTGEIIVDELDLVTHQMATQVGMPWEGVIAILVGVGIVIIAICLCCIRRCFKKRRTKKDKKGGDMGSVQLLGSQCKDKVISIRKQEGILQRS